MKELLTFLLFLFSISEGDAQIDTALINKTIEKSFQQSPVKGLAVSVVDINSVVVSKTLGKTKAGMLSEESPLCLGSVSKTLTALAICVLEEKGKLRLDQKINEVLNSANQFPDGNEISIKDLLHHHSGLSQESGYSKAIEYEGDFSQLESIEKVARRGIYSSTNYALLGRIIEEVSAKKYADFMKEEIFNPLGMDKSFVPEPGEGRLQEGYCLAYGIPVPARQMKYGKHIIPAGYIVTTLKDINKYTQFLLGDGTKPDNDNEESLLKADRLKSIFTPYKNNEYGYGKSWGIGKVGESKAYSHEGMTKISNAQITILPEEGLAINVMSNTNSGPFFSIASQTSERIVSIINAKEPEGKGRYEYIIRIIIGLLTLKIFYDLFIYIKRWSKAGYPKKLIFNPKHVHKYLFDIFPLLVLLILPKIIHTPISMLLRIMPDIGWAILLGAVVSIFHLYFRLVLPINYPKL